MGLPVLRLPLVVQRLLVPMFDTRDVIDLSFKYKAFRRMMKSTKLPCKSLKWFFKNRLPGITIGYGRRKQKIRLQMRRAADPFSDCGEVGSTTIAPSQCRFIRYEYVHPRTGCRRNNMWLRRNGGVHPIDIMQTYTSVLLDIFVPVKFKITWKLNTFNDLFNLFVWEITKKFSIAKFVFDRIPNPEEIPNAVTFLHDQIVAEGMVINIRDQENLPSIQLILKQKKMKVVDSPCFAFKTFLKAECHFLEIRRREVKLEDLKKVIHNWIAGGLPNLVCFNVKGFHNKKFGVAKVTKGIKTSKATGEPDIKIFEALDWEDNAVEIIRDSDKRKASIFLDHYEFAFIIWPADGVSWETDGVCWKLDDDDDYDGKKYYDTVKRVTYWDSGEDDDN